MKIVPVQINGKEVIFTIEIEEGMRTRVSPTELFNWFPWEQLLDNLFSKMYGQLGIKFGERSSWEEDKIHS